MTMTGGTMYTVRAVKADGTRVTKGLYLTLTRAQDEATTLQERLMQSNLIEPIEAVVIEKDGIECNRYDVQ